MTQELKMLVRDAVDERFAEGVEAKSRRAIRVLHVYKTYFPETYGGVEQTIYQICLGTSKRRITNRVVVLGNTTRKQYTLSRPEAEVYIYPTSLDIASCPISFHALAEFSKHTDWADIIHFHFPWPFGDVLSFTQRTRRPMVMTYHSDIVRQKRLLVLYKPLMRAFLNRINSIVGTSPNYLSTSDVLAKYRGKVQIIPTGLDKSSYPIASQQCVDIWRALCGEGFFLFIGVLRHYKGLHVLLDALVGAPYKAVIVGAGPIEPSLKKKADQLHLNNVHFVGYVSDEDKVALIQLCRAVISPSNLRAEAFGISLIEGAMYGKPLISSEIGTGTSFVNINGTTGIVVEPNNPAAFRGAMDWMHSSEDKAREMGAAAEERYRRYFKSDVMAEKYVALYESLAAEQTGLHLTRSKPT